METLLEDYKRRLKTANEMIEGLRFKDDVNPDYIRLTTKASCYRTIIAELERAVARKTKIILHLTRYRYSNVILRI